MTGKKELAVYATAPITKGEELLGEIRGGLAPLTPAEEAEISGLDSEMVRAAAAAAAAAPGSGASPEIVVELADGQSSVSVEALPVGRAMRDFSTVKSTRLKGHIIFMGPARFVNVRRAVRSFRRCWRVSPLTSRPTPFLPARLRPQRRPQGRRERQVHQLRRAPRHRARRGAHDVLVRASLPRRPFDQLDDG